KDHPNQQPVFRALLKSEFDRVGGFDPNRGYDDDWSLTEKLGYLAENVSKAVFYHYNPSTLSEIFTQSKWLAKRQYKFNIFGILVILCKSFLIVSIIKCILKVITYKFVELFIVTVVSDFRITLGILESLITQKKSR